MAKNLLQSGEKVIVYDVNEQNCSELKQHGAKIATSLQEVAQLSNAIITMLPSTPHVLKVYEAKDGKARIAIIVPGFRFRPKC